MHLPKMLSRGASITASTELVPVNPPVACYREHIAAVPTTLVLKEKSWSMSGDDFSITDAATGKAVLKCSGKYMSLHDRKKLSDTKGTMLYNISDSILALSKTIVCEDVHGKQLLKVKKKWSKGAGLNAQIVDTDDKEHTVEVRGEMFGTSATIVLDGKALAHIARKLDTAEDIASEKHTYNVTIAPGVDISMVAALCICFDEVEHEGNK